MEYENLLHDYVGEYGPYQWMIFTIASLDSFTYALYTLMPVFIAYTQPHWCSTPLDTFSNCSLSERMNFSIPQTCDGKTCVYSSCTMYVRNYSTIQVGLGLEDTCPLETNTLWNSTVEPCKTWTYGDSFYDDSAISEWDLVCDRKAEAATIGGIYMLGRFFGAVFLGPLPDRFGRRRVMLGTTVTVFFSAIGCALVPNFYVFLALRFTLALADMCRSSTGFIIGIEFSGRSKRVQFTGIWNIFWSVGYCCFTGLAYTLRHWRYLHLVSAAPEIIIFFVYLIFLPESPRWLLLKEKNKEVHKIIEKMAKMNKSRLPEGWQVVCTDKNLKKGSCVDLFRTPGLRMVTFILSYIFFANSFVYYGLSMNTSNLAGNPFLNCFLSGVVDVPASAFVYFCYGRIPRLPVYSAFTLAAGTSLMLTLAVPTDMWWVTVALSTVGKLFIGTTFLMTWLVVSELFPTAIRGIGLGITNGSARLASFVAAYVGLLASVHITLPTIVFASSALLAGAFVLVLPETRLLTLPQTVSEGEQILTSHMFDICRPNRQRDGRSRNKEEAV